jgi:hypothetical protein
VIGRSVKAKLLVFAIFILGIGGGVLLANFYTTRVASAPAPGPPDQKQRAQRDINKFYDYLGGVTPEQREKMHAILEETGHEFQNLRKETQPKFEAIQEASRTKIRAVLNDDQRQKYDDFRKRMDERRRNRDLNKNSNSNNNKDRDSGSDHGTKSN